MKVYVVYIIDCYATVPGIEFLGCFDNLEKAQEVKSTHSWAEIKELEVL